MTIIVFLWCNKKQTKIHLSFKCIFTSSSWVSKTTPNISFTYAWTCEQIMKNWIRLNRKYQYTLVRVDKYSMYHVLLFISVIIVRTHSCVGYPCITCSSFNLTCIFIGLQVARNIYKNKFLPADYATVKMKQKVWLNVCYRSW